VGACVAGAAAPVGAACAAFRSFAVAAGSVVALPADRRRVAGAADFVPFAMLALLHLVMQALEGGRPTVFAARRAASGERYTPLPYPI
jgi:hypothetical protein